MPGALKSRRHRQVPEPLVQEGIAADRPCGSARRLVRLSARFFHSFKNLSHAGVANSFVKDSLKHPLLIVELFGQCDHNAVGAAEVTESVHVLVLRNFANKLGPVLLQASNDVINVRDGKHDAAYAECVHRYIRFSADGK
jgi:hypothetical protein